jgi:predicted transposase YbfD/YdcC
MRAEAFAQSVRSHWSIENSCHWVLDVTFDEDHHRTRHRRLASNLSWLKRTAITLIKQHPLKDSIRGKRQRAGWSNAFMLQVLTGKDT